MLFRSLVAAAGPGGLPARHDAFLAAQDPAWAALERCRERDECLEKLVTLGLVEAATPA